MFRHPRSANFSIILDAALAVILKDLGPHDVHRTITNDAEHVVESLDAKWLNGRTLLYLDTMGRVDEIRYERVTDVAGVYLRFLGFAPGYPTLDLALHRFDVPCVVVPMDRKPEALPIIPSNR